MATFAIKSIASGAIFGAALTASGVYSPTVIIDELYLRDFHMLKTFIAASASSAYVSPPFDLLSSPLTSSSILYAAIYP
jgi:hypothetical protein